MSKTNIRRPQKKTTLKKHQDWDSTVGDLSQHRLSDDETSRRKQAYQSRNLQLIQEEKQRKVLAKAVQDAKKNNSNQLGILREILFNERDIDELVQKSNHVLHSSRSEKFVPKSSVLRSGKNHFTSLTNGRTRKTSTSSTKQSSIRNLNSPGGADWNQSEEDNISVSSQEGEEDELENEPVRLNRSNSKSNSQRQHHHHRESSTERDPFHSTTTTTRNLNQYSQSRQQSNGTRPVNNVSFMSDTSKLIGKTTTPTDLTNNTSSTNQLKTLLDRLSYELNDLETITGFKSEKTNSSLHNQANTCSTALLTALISLTGHVKQCALSTKGQQANQDTNILKDQLSVVIKAQLDFQQKIENQISMLQTMMQTVCQLVNNEIISTKKTTNNSISQPTPMNSARTQRDRIEHQIAEPRQHFSNTNNNNSQPQRTKIISTDELLSYTQRMNTATPTDMNQYRYSTYSESNEISNKYSRPGSAISTNDNHTHDFSRQIPQRRILEQESRSSMISPIDLPSSYDLFESGLPKSNSTTSMLRNATNNGLTGASNSLTTTASNNETILEKILQERLLLVQQIAELNKQHEMTQEELASLEANALQQRSS
ncbi:hypothetical protein I4U23_028695 [Adineta vaga]|nr:hypothetical protein I4U23_028695 [Adineta vaga]